MKDKQNMKVIVVLAIAIAVVFGVLLIAYCICKRKNLRGNITFFDQLWKKYQGKVEKLRWLLIAFEQVKHVTSPGLCLVVKLKKIQENLGFLQFFSILKIEILYIFIYIVFFFLNQMLMRHFLFNI